MSENGLDSGSDSIDPRVQIELERLNSATDDINKLEVDLDESRASFRSLLCDSAARLDGLSRKLGSCIEKARPYYEARMRASEAAKEAQDAAVQYERANSAHSAAREMVYLAEQGLGGRCTLDPAWQEMLNHATQRVNEAESARALAGAQHMKAGRRLGDTAAVAQRLQRELRRSIAKSSFSARRNLLLINITAYQHHLLLLPYFEMKAQLNQQLELQKIKVQALEKQVGNAKLTYAEALRNLEQISDEIHRHRRLSRQHEQKPSTPSRDRFTRTPEKTTTVHSNRYSDPIASFPDYPYNEASTAVFYNQTYLPDTQSTNAPAKSRFPEKFAYDSRNAEANFETARFDEYKSLPKNISPKSTPIKTKNRPEEISGYRNISTDHIYSTNPFKTEEIEMKNICDSDDQSSSGLTKSITNEWTEINLDSSSPEELVSDPKNDIPYQRFDASPPDTCEQSHTTTTPKKRVLTKQMTLPTNSESKTSSIKAKMKLDSNISNWISRSSAKNEEAATSGYNSSRRQSLDNILGPTSEKVKEIFSHGIMMLNISSLTDRRNSEPRCADSPLTGNETGKGIGAKKIPSPLEKTLTYLTSNNDDDTTGSDTDSLASCDMLTEEQIHSLMLDRDIDLVCEQLLGTPISEVCPKLIGTTPTSVPPAITEASVDNVAVKSTVLTSLAATPSHK